MISSSQQRPEWYHRYHNWKHSTLVNWCILVVSVFMLMLGSATFFLSVNAASVTTKLTETIFPSTKKNIQLQFALSFSPIQSNISEEQISTAVLKNIIFSNPQGNNADWAVIATCTDFFSIAPAVRLSGRNDTVTSGGIYDDKTSGDYIVTITKSGSVNTAQFTVQGLEYVTNQLTGTNVPVGTHGVTATFANGYYKVGDTWQIHISTIPVHNLSLIPQITDKIRHNISPGGRHNFSSPDDATTIISTHNTNVSDVTANLLFSLTIPPFTHAGKYTAVLSITSD